MSYYDGSMAGLILISPWVMTGIAGCAWAGVRDCGWFSVLVSLIPTALAVWLWSWVGMPALIGGLGVLKWAVVIWMVAGAWHCVCRYVDNKQGADR